MYLFCFLGCLAFVLICFGIVHLVRTWVWFVDDRRKRELWMRENALKEDDL